VPLRVSLLELGLRGRWSVRDLWQQRYLGMVESDIAPVVPWHGAALYRVSPQP